MLRPFLTVAISGLALAATALPAQACRIFHQFDVNYIERADAVVVGRISDYQIVRDQRARDERAQWLATSPDISPASRERLETQTGFLGDYARFTVTVDEVLVGRPPHKFEVTWDNSTFGEPPELNPGPWLIALRDPSLRVEGQISIPGWPEVQTWTPLQQSCSSAFILRIDSDEAAEARRLVR